MPHLDPPGRPGDQVPGPPPSPAGRGPHPHRARHGDRPEWQDYPPPGAPATPVRPGPAAGRPPEPYRHPVGDPDDETRADLPRVEPERTTWPTAGETPSWVLGTDAADPLAGGGRTGRSRAQRRAESHKHKAGRNLPAALAVGAGLAGAVLASLLIWRPAFLVVVAAAVCVGSWEMTRAVRASGARPPLPPLLGGGVTMAVAAWWWGPDALALGLLVTVLAMMVWRLGDGPAGYQRDVNAGTLIAVYVPFLAGFAVLLAEPDDGHWRVLVTLGVVVLSDTGGYVAGVLFGRHPMSPKVSPKKSWEGFVGSLLAAAIGGAVALSLLLPVDWWWGAGFGLVVAGAAVLGDLAESLLKRDLGVKDMSGLLPGHGGLMDRLDSILFAAPTAYLLLTVLAG